ncbi:MAG: hypothetical protein GY869_19330, partial [Planctomycetes bacterium]|nr:hypothetical protein [Planctomycetota bacterium]
NAYVVGSLDLDGNPRVVDGDGNSSAIVDMGCYERAGGSTPQLTVTVPASATEGDLPKTGTVSVASSVTSTLTVNLSSSDTEEAQVSSPIYITSGTSSKTFSITIVDDSIVDGTDSATITATASGYNQGSDSITVYDNDGSGPTPTHYVSKTGSNEQPYDTWGKAARVIQDAVDEATAGDTVVVNDGVYSTGGGVTPGGLSSNRVLITKNITVESFNGPANTVILGAPDPGTGGSGANSVRGVYMNTGQLNGFTISNGYTTLGLTYLDIEGGGINMYNGNGVVNNCVISGNYSGYEDEFTGGYGGGVSYGTVNNSIIIGNTAGGFGGGASFSTVNNCLIVGNTALRLGGGTRLSTVNNCTVVGNSANKSGGGISGGAVTNCIVYNNSAGEDNPNINGGDVGYSCSPGPPAGTGNIADPPQFVSGGGYQLDTGSPCIDQGNNAYVVGSLDLDGNPRVVDGDGNSSAIVDMGCYEFG